MQPLFYSHSADGICVGDDALDVVDDVSRLDWRGLAAFFRIGFFLGDHTAFADVKQVPPATVLTWTPREGVAMQVGTRARGPRVTLDRAGAIERYARLFEDAVKTTANGKEIVVPLSGGRDGRHVMFALMNMGANPSHLVTTEHLLWRTNEDARIARTVAAAARRAAHVALPTEVFCQEHLSRRARDRVRLGRSGMGDTAGRLHPIVKRHGSGRDSR